MSFYFEGKPYTVEESDGVRGYSLETNENLDDGQDEYFGYEEQNDNGRLEEDLLDPEGENDKVPVMSADFYDQFENFLRKEPPKIGDSMGAKDCKQKKKKKKSDDVHEKEVSQIPTLPPVNMPRRQIEYQAEAKVSKRKSSGGDAKKQKAIDPQLLREAFAYTDQLLRNAVLEEAVEQQYGGDEDNRINKKYGGIPQKERKTHSAPAPEVAAGDRDYLFFGAPIGKGKNAPVNVVRNLKSKKKQQVGNGGGRPVHMDDFFVKKEEEIDLKRNPLNFDELVSNFQNGTTLERLRKELEDSRNSLKNSKSAIRDLMRK